MIGFLKVSCIFSNAAVYENKLGALHLFVSPAVPLNKTSWNLTTSIYVDNLMCYN